MKKTRVQRWLSLLLTLAVCLTLAPAVRAEEPFRITTGHGDAPWEIGASDRADQFEVVSGLPEGRRVIWVSDTPTVATINDNGILTPLAAGEATISAYYMTSDGKRVDAENKIKVVVSGLTAEPVEVEENGSKTLTVKAYGNAIQYAVTYTVTSGDYFIAVDGDTVSGLHIGEGKVTASTSSGGYVPVEFTVTVIANSSTRIPQNKDETLPLKSGEAKSFRDLKSYFDKQLNGDVQYITGLFVSTNQGTLYYGYQSEAQPGAGIGQAENYYRNPAAGQRDISDITFVPKSTYAGGDATITYTAVTYNAETKENRTYSCQIVFTIQGPSSSGGGTSSASGISLETGYGEAVKFDSIEFGSVCREKLGVQLDHVIFSQPPERQGTLYTNYVSSGSYGSVVDVHRQYSRRNLDDIWFVPAPGYYGTVTVHYTGFGSSGESYSGQVNITVRQMSESTGGGQLSYSAAPGGVVHFTDVDKFNAYCKAIMGGGQTISGIRFESLPGESEGVLYYDYRSSTNPGTPVTAGTVYYPGTLLPRIDRLAFVVSENFTGSINLPFTGWTTDGSSFGGTIEINVTGGAVSSGDIYYYCAPDKSVRFVGSDFTNLSRAHTNRTLDYIYFVTLPDSSQGDLYYNNSLIRNAGENYRYYNNNLSRLTFRASENFSGTVSIRFVGVSTAANGDSFTGVITIGSSRTGSTTNTGSTSTGNSSTGNSSTTHSGTIRYITDSQTAAVFERDDFDDLSLWEYNRDISSVRFERADLPSSSQGSLYQNYRSSSNMGTKITSGTTITASNLDRLAFVPASGYTGTVYIDFTGTATGSSDRTFSGTLEIDVGAPAANVMAQYSTRTAPVRFYAGDLAQGGSSLSSIRFTSLPSSGAGYLYYQYSSPTQYGTQVNTSTTYRTSGSNLISDLTFVPRAGYTGTVTIPYTGTNSNNTTFTGEVIITVSPTNSSYYFNDMAGYSGAQISAVDFLYDHNVTRGLGDGLYGPENPIRRGDFALMLYQAFEFVPVSYGTTFTDVSPDAYYATAVNTLYARGVVSGTGNGRYAPDSTLTRQDAICMVQRAMQTIGWSASDGYASALAGYNDSANVSGYAQGAMALAVQRGYLPTSGGRLNPQQPLTRVDMAELLHRALTY